MRDNLRPARVVATPIGYNPCNQFSERLARVVTGQSDTTDEKKNKQDRELALCWLEETKRR